MAVHTHRTMARAEVTKVRRAAPALAGGLKAAGL